MKHLKRLLTTLLILVMLLSYLPGLTFAAKAPYDIIARPAQRTQELTGYNSPDFIRSNSYQYSDDELVRAIIVFDGNPAALADNGNEDAAIARLDKQHDMLRKSMQSGKIDYTELFDYSNVLNGMAIEVAYGKLDAIAAMKGVDTVYIANTYSIPDDTVQSEYANQTTGANLIHNAGYDGSGIVVAVLDTGITPNHEAFGVYDGMLQTVALEENDADTVIDQIGRGTYLSKKIPFAYDYADADNDATDDGEKTAGHGTHVSGIAVGYAESEDDAITFCGAAPDAQLLAMKIFPTDGSSTSSDVYFAALDDAYKLGADIINMSLGSQNGFTYDSSLEGIFGNIYKTLEDAGILVVTAAGNEYSQARYASNNSDIDYLTTDYTDYGTLSSPSSYDGNLAVASVENASYLTMAFQVGEKNISYTDSTGTFEFIKAMGGKTYDFVAVPNYGVLNDYTSIDVNGKIALISRGGITFEDKINYAADAGAVGAIIYNNTDGSIGMSINNYAIPAISILQTDGQWLVNYFKANSTASPDNNKMFFSDVPLPVVNPNAGKMSEFSGWGCTNDLRLKPQITGIGGMVYSVAFRTVNSYSTKSGTSMATPNVAGNYASMLEAVISNYPDMTRQQRAAYIEAITESTANIITRTDNIPYSPRNQGSGVIDIYDAINIPSYILEPICNIGDDAKKNGVYTIGFTVKNQTDTEQVYTVNPIVMYDNVEEIDVGTPNNPNLRTYNTLISKVLSETEYSFNAPESVTVPANGTVDVSVTVTLSYDARATLNNCYPNGIFIEGFVELIPTAGDGDIHATFLGYYGDWESAPILEQHDWREIVKTYNDLRGTVFDSYGRTYADCGYTYKDILKWEVNTDINIAYLYGKSENRSYLTYAGDNLFGIVDDYKDDRIAVSNSLADGTVYGTSVNAYPMNVRNARHIIMVVTDAITGKVYAVDDTDYVNKVYYNTTDSIWIGISSFYFDGTNIYDNPDEPIALPNNTKVNINYYANLAYGEDTLGAIAYEDLLTHGESFKVWSYPCTIDNTKPVIDVEGAVYNEESGKLTVTVTDNQYLSYIAAYDKNNNVLDSVLFNSENAGQSHEVVLDIGNESPVIYLAADDYATNENYIELAVRKAKVTYSVPEGFTVSGGTEHEINVGESIVLPSITGTPVGDYTFYGWTTEVYPTNVRAENVTTKYKPGTNYNVTDDITLYAVFNIYITGESFTGLDLFDQDVSTILNKHMAIAGRKDEQYYLMQNDFSALNLDDSGFTVVNDNNNNITISDFNEEIMVYFGYDFNVECYIISTHDLKFLELKPDNSLCISADFNDGIYWNITFDNDNQVFITSKNDSYIMVFDEATSSFMMSPFSANIITNIYLFEETTILPSYTEYTTKPGEAVLTDSSLKFKQASLSLESDISINFYVKDSVLNGWSNPYVVFTKALYDAQGNITEYVTETITEYSRRNTESELNCRMYTFKGINSTEMGSEVTATLYGTKQGTVFKGETVNYSVLQYATNMLGKSTDPKLNTMLVDLLNYGASAQTYFDYNAVSLCTAGLTAEQLAYGTQQNPTLSTCRELIQNEGATVSFKSCTLMLEEKVSINYYLNLANYTGSIDDLCVKITYADANGNVIIKEIDSSELKYRFYNGSYYYMASFTDLNPLQMKTECRAEVFSKTSGERISNTLRYSIESYANSKANDSDAGLVALVNAMMKYGNAVENYFR